MFVVHHTLLGSNGETYETRTELDVQSKEQAEQKMEEIQGTIQYWTIDIDNIIEKEYE